MSEEKQADTAPGATANAASENGPDPTDLHIFGKDAIRVKCPVPNAAPPP
jgi:hypothetical protein